ncbi:glycerophosphodiester phosphodiesterase family protein [Arthrobacter sp. D3-16]
MSPPTAIRPFPLVIAHRGASGYRPEHTLAGYELALKLGADAIEPDVVATRDGVLVVRHENEISGTTNISDCPEFRDRRTTKLIDGEEVTGWFTEDFTWKELSTLRSRERLPVLRPGSALFNDRYPIMRLADAIAFISHAISASGKPLRLIVEFKHPTYFSSIGLPLHELFLNELDIAGFPASADWLTVESFEKTCLHNLQNLGVLARRVYLARRKGAAFDLVSTNGSSAKPYVEELTPKGLSILVRRQTDIGGPTEPTPWLHGISVEKCLIVDEPREGKMLVETSHAAGLSVFCWTLRPENAFLSPRHRAAQQGIFGNWRSELACTLESGVDGIFTDYPDLVLSLRDTWV